MIHVSNNFVYFIEGLDKVFKEVRRASCRPAHTIPLRGRARTLARNASKKLCVFADLPRHSECHFGPGLAQGVNWWRTGTTHRNRPRTSARASTHSYAHFQACAAHGLRRGVGSDEVRPKPSRRLGVCAAVKGAYMPRRIGIYASVAALLRA